MKTIHFCSLPKIFFNFKMGVFILGKLKNKREKEKVDYIFLMDQCMKDIGKMDFLMVKVGIFILMEIFAKVTLNKVNYLVMDNTN